MHDANEDCDGCKLALDAAKVLGLDGVVIVGFKTSGDEIRFDYHHAGDDKSTTLAGFFCRCMNDAAAEAGCDEVGMP